MTTYMEDYLAHFGIKGMKWGIRRFMDENGVLTEEGRRRYGYTDTGTGGKKTKDVRSSLKESEGKPGTTRIASLTQKAVDAIKEKTKRPSQMTDEELRNRINRMQMEKQYKQLKQEMSGKVKNQNQQSFAQKHPLMKQLILDNATRTLSSIIQDQMRTKSDEILAEKRMERAKKNGMLDQKLFPFVSKENAARISSYNKSEEKRIEDAKATAKIINDTVQQRSEAIAEAARKQQAKLDQKNAENAVKKAFEISRKQAEQELWAAKKTAERNANNAVDTYKARQSLLKPLSSVPISSLLVPGTTAYEEAMKKWRVPKG